MSECNSKPSDEELRKLLKPNPSPGHVLAAIRSHYLPELSSSDNSSANEVVILKELESYDDRNYLVRLRGAEYLVKIHNGVESAQYIRSRVSNETDLGNIPLNHPSPTHPAERGVSSVDLQNAIFFQLNQPQYGLRTSLPVPPTVAYEDPMITLQEENEQLFVCIHSFPVVSSLYSPCHLVVRVMEWVPGKPMSSWSPLGVEIVAQAGAYLGKICHALDDLTRTNPFAVKSANRYHAWDGKNTLDLERFVSYIQDRKRRSLVESVLQAFREEIVNPEFRKGILHGDFNDANILLNDEGRVNGVIDFGDSTLSWRVLDVTIAMAYAMLSTYGKNNRSLSAAAAMLRGFHSIYPLDENEQKHLRLLVAARLSCSVTIGAYSYQQNPENTYLLFHSEPAWKTLELLWRGGKTGTMACSVNELFKIACSNITTVVHDKTLLDCSDISFPDPHIPDPLQSMRVPSMFVFQTQLKPVITFVTGNPKKLEEVLRILSKSQSENRVSLPFDILDQKIDLPELQGDDPVLIVKEKCRIASGKVCGAVIVEDTSLCFSALGNLPGPYIKWFLDKCGHAGLNDMILFSHDKSAYAQTVMAFCPNPGEDVIVFDGRTRGKIVAARGELDFGWDPIFEPDEGNGLTYAEMKKEMKDAISHRNRALQKLRDYLINEAENIISKMSLHSSRASTCYSAV